MRWPALVQVPPARGTLDQNGTQIPINPSYKSLFSGTKFASRLGMRKKHFKLGIGILTGLAGYFVALSVMLVASASGSDSRGFGFSISKKSRAHSDIPHKAADLRADSESITHKSTIRAIGQGESGPVPCLVLATCNSGTSDQETDGPTAWNERGLGSSVSTNGQDASNSNNFSDPSSAGFFGAGSPFGPFGTGNGSNAQISNGRGSSGDPTTADLTDPGLPSVALDISTLGQVQLIPQGDPASSGNPPGDNPPSPPAPPSNPPGPLAVPEPPSFWVFFTGLILLVARFVLPGTRGALRENGNSLDTCFNSSRRHLSCRQPSGISTESMSIMRAFSHPTNPLD